MAQSGALAPPPPKSPPKPMGMAKQRNRGVSSPPMLVLVASVLVLVLVASVLVHVPVAVLAYPL